MWPHLTPPLASGLPRRKENNGNDPTINLISKSSGWGAPATPTDDQRQQGERAIPASAAPAWGGAGLPEERKKQVGAGCWGGAGGAAVPPPRTCRGTWHAAQGLPCPSAPLPSARTHTRVSQVEMASQREFPHLGDERGPRRPHDRHPYDDDPRRRPWDADERSFAGARRSLPQAAAAALWLPRNQLPAGAACRGCAAPHVAACLPDTPQGRLRTGPTAAATTTGRPTTGRRTTGRPTTALLTIATSGALMGRLVRCSMWLRGQSGNRSACV